MDRFPQMLYRANPAGEQIHGGRFDTTIVADEAAFDDAKAAGWHESTGDAAEAAEAAKEAESGDGEQKAPEHAHVKPTRAKKAESGV